jgi:restriction system protein
MGPILDCLRSLGGSAKSREVVDWIADKLGVSDEKRAETLKSGQGRFDNQVAWARQYLVWDELLNESRRGVWTLTKKGSTTHLSDKDNREIFLKWVAIHAKARSEEAEAADSGAEPAPEDEADVPPEEFAGQELLLILQSLPWDGFERICQRLLRETGFEMVTVTGRSHDGGIDGNGILQINPFVSFKVLFQCKKYKGTVSRAQVGDFRNAMIGRADKGIIMTTGIFSADAIREANREGAPPIELVNGEKLVSMFQAAKLGVTERVVYDVDRSFFEQFRNKNSKNSGGT